MIVTIVFLLGAATCVACAILLLRGYGRTRARLLLWSGLCFAFLALNNLLLCINADTMFFADLPDLTALTDAASLTGVCLLLFGLIWDVRE